MPEITLMLYWERAKRSPAMKAPRERESPRALVRSAMPRQSPSVVRSKISLVLVRMTASISLFRPKYAKSSTPPKARTTHKIEKKAFSKDNSSVPASKDTLKSMGATMMS